MHKLLLLTSLIVTSSLELPLQAGKLTVGSWVDVDPSTGSVSIMKDVEWSGPLTVSQRNLFVAGVVGAAALLLYCGRHEIKAGLRGIGAGLVDLGHGLVDLGRGAAELACAAKELVTGS